jgi:hypothetical protein
MSPMKNPYDYIEWHPRHDRDTVLVRNRGKEKRMRRKYTDRMGERRMELIYDLIILCTLVAVFATLLKLLLS